MVIKLQMSGIAKIFRLMVLHGEGVPTETMLQRNRKESSIMLEVHGAYSLLLLYSKKYQILNSNQERVSGIYS